MSVNSAIDQSYLAQVDALSRLLRDFIGRRRAAPTQSEKVLIEAQAVQLFEQLLDLDFKLEQLRAGDYPEYENFQGDYATFSYLLQVNLAKLRKLADLFVKHFNSQQYALADLLGRLKRIRQKRAALALWNGEDAKFVLADHFLNLDWVDNKHTADANCFVDTAQGVLTLPVRDQQGLPLKSIVIGSGSNGQPGNSDEAVTVNNISPDYAINGDPNNWFEYERLDSGPLELSLVVELTKAQVVNNITIAPLNIGQTYTYVVSDILLSTAGQNQVSAKTLAGPLDKDRMLVRSAGNDTEWSLTFLPTLAKTITIKLVQAHPHSVQVATNNGGVAERKRYALGISKLAVNQLKFDSVGGINSVERDLPSGLYLTIPVVDIWPPKPELFDALIEVSFDGGETWISAENVDDSIGESVLMDGTQASMIWRLRMLRDDDSLDNATSFLPDSNPIKKTKTLMKAVSTHKSPSHLTLPERPARSEVFAIQPRIARRGNRFKRIYLGRGSGQTTRFELPFSPVAGGLDPESMTVYVNGYTYEYVEDNGSLTAEQWSFSDDFQEIELSEDLADGSKVEVVFDEERMLFEQRADGYYHQMELLFDPDEDNIQVTYLPRRAARHTKLLPRDKRIIHLGVSNLDTDGFVLTSNKGTVHVAVSTRATLASTPNSYMLDAENGVLWLNSELDDEIVRATFDHSTGQALSTDSFDVVFAEGTVRPWGVRVAPEDFQAVEEEDTVGSSLKKRVNVLTGSFGARTPKVSAASDAMTLSHDYVVKGSLRVSSDMFDRTYVNVDAQEVDFVDGKSEFLGLIPMNSEKTVATTADGLNDTVSFALAAGALWYEGFEVLFGDSTTFATLVGSVSAVNSTGKYFVGGDGVVTVYVSLGGTLAADTTIHYYYQDPEFEPANKYSVDYKAGVLYGGADLQAGATVKYKASAHRVAYNVAQEIDRYSYDKGTNSMSIRTEGLKQINSLVKLIWAEKTQEESLKSLRDYFTPIISLLAFRFT
jgi:hypothetical protein